MNPEWIGPITQLATAGGFGALVWYFVVYLIPSILKEHREEREQLSKQHTEAMEKQTEVLKNMHTSLTRIEARNE